MTIKEVRTNVLGFTIKRMAQELGISWNGYWMKESGRRNFKAHEVIKICRLAGIHAEQLEL